jgi:hypothetical protein
MCYIREDDEVMDLTHLSAESVMEILKKLPDDKQIKIVKTPTYNVTKEGYDMNQDEDFEFDDMDEDWDIESEVEGYDEDFDMNEYGYTQEMEDMEEGEEGEFSPLGYDPTQTLTNPYNTPFNEAKLDKFIKEAVQRYTNKNKKPNNTKLVAEEQSRIKIATLRNKMQQMQEAMRKMNEENKILKEHAQVLKKNLQEAKNAVDYTVLQAKKIVYVKTLAEKFNLDKKQVATVVEKFEQVKSLTECQNFFGLQHSIINRILSLLQILFQHLGVFFENFILLVHFAHRFLHLLHFITERGNFDTALFFCYQFSIIGLFIFVCIALYRFFDKFV